MYFPKYNKRSGQATFFLWSYNMILELAIAAFIGSYFIVEEEGEYFEED